MKRILALCLSLMLILSVCGCTPSSTSSDTSSDVETEYIETVESDITASDGNSQSDTPTASSKPTSSSNSSSGNDNNNKDNSSTTDNPTSSTSKPEDKVKIDFNTTVEMDICSNIIRGYLSATETSQQYFFLSEYEHMKHEDYQKLNIEWDNDGSEYFNVYFSENADFSNSYIIKVKATDGIPQNAICIPGKTYYWKVLGEISKEPLNGGKFHVTDKPVRPIYLEGVGNVRDIGGWKTESGKKVAYGKIYRGRTLNAISAEGLKTLKALGIKTEIDIRHSGNNPAPTANSGLNYQYIENVALQYDYIFDDRQTASAYFQKVFNLLSNPDNYPIYTHCTAGADRTGTLIYILNGLLGVSYEDLTRDFELTSFSSSGKRWRGNGNGTTFPANDLQMEVEGNHVAWGKLHKEMMDTYGSDGNLSKAIERYLVVDMGVPKAQIDSFKQIMLG